MRSFFTSWSMRLAWREIRANRRFSLFFCLNLVLGFSGLIALDAFKDSLQSNMGEKSKYLLGADLSISARRQLTDLEIEEARKILGPDVRETHTLELYSTLQGKKISRLAEIRAIQKDYPFYGKLTLEDGRVSPGGSERELESSRSIWLSPELALQLGVQVGEEVGVGAVKFRVSGIVADDTASSWRGFSLASPAWVGFSKITDTGLVRKGSSISHRFLYQFPESQDIHQARDLLAAHFKDPSLRITTHERSSDQVGRTVDYVNDYLGLVSLVALFFSALGAAYLFRGFLTSKLSETAVLVTLGVPNREASRVFWIQLMILGTGAAVIAVLLAVLLLPGMSAFLRQFLLVPFQAHLSLGSVLLALFLGSVGSVLIGLPLLTKIEDLKPAQLFSEESQPTVGVDRRKIPSLVILFFVFGGLACWQAKSWIVGTLFTLGFTLAALSLMGVGLLFLSGLSILKLKGFSFRTRIALRNLARSKLSVLSCFLALGLGSLLLNLIPQIQGNIQSELQAPSESVLPGLFLFDIQDEQVKNLQVWMKEKQEVPLDHLSPMIRARLQAVNGKPFERDEKEYAAATREEERDARSKNRMFNLNYREKLTVAESIVEGRAFQGVYDSATGKEPEITLEHRFAGRLGLKLQDLVTFDVEGVEVTGRVVGLKRINWMSFQPNFFVTFQPGVLEEAPKTWLAAVRKLPLDQKIELQNSLVEKFTNISVVDVESTVAKFLGVFGQIGLAIKIMALLTLIAGFAVLFSIAQSEANSRKRESSLLKVLGASFQDVEGIFMLEIFWISSAAAALGSLLSLFFSYLLMERVFDMPWVPDFRLPFLCVIVVPLLSVILAKLSARRALQVKPSSLL